MNSPAADELEREIDITRRAVDRTLTALQFELSPRRRAQVAWRRAKRRTESSLRSGADWAVANRASVSLGAVAVIAACVAAAWRQER
ncbi:MAG: DUF3618 domain-containing protein [Proteobacteria bacterium]|nr:DUF3618 domain-containing protein [Pseudomonadota bacterium]